MYADLLQLSEHKNTINKGRSDKDYILGGIIHSSTSCSVYFWWYTYRPCGPREAVLMASIGGGGPTFCAQKYILPVLCQYKQTCIKNSTTH